MQARVAHSMVSSTPAGVAGRQRLHAWLLSALAALLFGLAYSQSPLYTSNQNQYFLHGAAHAGLGFLSEDWLAKTADPAPVFSWIVEWTFRLLPTAVFYLEYLLLFGVYLAGLWLLADALFELRASTARTLLFLGAVVLLHSAALRVIQDRALGESWSYLWDGGVAGQRLLGPVYQASAFGVFLLLSVGLFALGRAGWASASAALSACIHPTYLLPAAILVLSYCLITWRDLRSLRHPIRLGLIALALVAPIVLYVVLVLGPTGPDNFALAQQILVQERVPHHALPSAWLHPSILVKLTLIILALVAAARTRVGGALAIAAAAGLALTIAQIFADSPTLALLFPWRISAVLVPAAVGILAGWIARRVTGKPRTVNAMWQRLVSIGCVTIMILLAVAGAVGFLLQRAQRGADPAAGLFAFVRAHVRSGEVYLIPAGLQEFRLATGAPVLVDRKSIPYLDIDVIEWSERIRLAGWFYRDDPGEVNCALLDSAAADYGVTHVVLNEALLSLTCAQFREEYRDTHYAVEALAVP